MVTLKRITQAEDEAFRKLTALYTEAFPVEERREIGQLGELLHTEPAMYFNAVECDGQLAGLFVYWDFGSFYYLEHLAVFAEMRKTDSGLGERTAARGEITRSRACRNGDGYPENPLL